MTDPAQPDKTGFDPNGTFRERRLARALADFSDLLAAEEKVDIGEYCSQYPDLAPDLREQLETVAQMEGMLAPIAEATTGAAKAEEIPPRLSGHRILRQLGSGGMGRVFLAQDEGLGREVAIKTLHPRLALDPNLRSRFMREARALASISHPHIVRIYSLGPAEEIPHFVMERVSGAPLTEACQPLPMRQKAELMRKVALAVDFLHQNGIVHRDLKPGNILVGSDMEPKLLDFGLARQFAPDERQLTRAGEIMGTPDYFSPEQARADASLDARSDVFSLGAVLYEMLTGSPPFRSDRLEDQLRLICEEDPVLPRRRNSEVPGPLQNICLKALEKEPVQRYRSAREMALDLERYLAGESVLADPTSYSRLMSGKVEQHLRELRGWLDDRILSVYEFDSFRRLYERLFEREDAWILEVRRLSLAQVALYLGAWVLVVAADLILFFRHPRLAGTAAVAVVVLAAVPTAWLGTWLWSKHHKRIAVAYLLAFCLLLPLAFLVGMKEWSLLPQFSQGKESLEFFALFSSFREPGPGKSTIFRGPTNAQVWWAITLALPAYFGLRRFTRSSVFSLVFAFMGALLCAVTLMRWGMLEWLDSDPGRVYFRLLPFAALYFVTAATLERLPCPLDSRYFYPVAVIFIFISLSGVAGFHEPYARWLKETFPHTRGQLEYLFIINAGVYLTLQGLCERFGSPQMRSAAKAFRFVIPGHVLTSLLLLGLSATQRWQESPHTPGLLTEARFFEVLLPIAACLFVLGSVPKQMKNFLATGLFFLAIGLGRLQQGMFRERAVWPIALLMTGLLLMLVAANFSRIKRMFHRD